MCAKFIILQFRVVKLCEKLCKNAQFRAQKWAFRASATSKAERFSPVRGTFNNRVIWWEVRTNFGGNFRGNFGVHEIRGEIVTQFSRKFHNCSARQLGTLNAVNNGPISKRSCPVSHSIKTYLFIVLHQTNNIVYLIFIIILNNLFIIL